MQRIDGPSQGSGTAIVRTLAADGAAHMDGGRCLLRRAVCVASIVAALFAAACGGDEEVPPRAERGSEPGSPTDGRPSAEPRSESGKANGERRISPSSDSHPGGSAKTVTTESGAVVVTPPRPTKSEVAPGGGCVLEQRGIGAQRRTVWLPPRPGFQATRTREGVLLSYKFRGATERCAPSRLQVTFDVNDDPLPGRSTYLRVNGREGRLRLDLPDDLEGADVVRVSALTKRGVPGQSASAIIASK